jgi:hypothetical protein
MADCGLRIRSFDGAQDKFHANDKRTPKQASGLNSIASPC